MTIESTAVICHGKLKCGFANGGTRRCGQKGSGKKLHFSDQKEIELTLFSPLFDEQIDENGTSVA